MAKLDFTSAYRHVPIHPSEYTAMGIKWKFRDSKNYTYKVDTRLPFGASKSLFSIILHRVLLGWPKQEIVFKKDKATLHVISKRCEDTVNYSN